MNSNVYIYIYTHRLCVYYVYLHKDYTYVEREDLIEIMVNHSSIPLVTYCRSFLHLRFQERGKPFWVITVLTRSDSTCK